MPSYADVGEKLKATLDSLNDKVAEARTERDDFRDAWAGQDWTWLHEAGYLTKAEHDRMVKPNPSRRARR